MRQGRAVNAFDRRHDRGDGAVERELDQHAGGGGHRSRHGVEEAARTPVQQRAGHDEQQVVGVQAGDGGDRRLAGELLGQPATGQHHQQDDQQRAVFQPFARTGRLDLRRRAEARVDATGLGVAGAGGAGGGHVGDHQGHQHQCQQHHARLPEEDGLGKGDHAGDGEDRGRQAGRVGLQLRRRRRQAQRPDGAQAQVGGGTGGAVVHLQLFAAGQGAHQQAAEDQGEAPVEQRGEHGDQRHPAHRRAAVLRHAGQQVDQPRGRAGTGDHVAADDHEGHLHGEGNQAPETVAEGLGGLAGRCPHGQGGDRHQQHGDGGEDPGIGEPAFRPVRAAHGKAC
ncbi:hypothetical protein FQZ97_743750 [compost metagenome]